MTALNYIFAFVVMLSVLIFVHELGHFLVAKACGVRVLKFCLGFGPPVGFGRFRLAWKRGHTEYAIAWFPLGGFVKMLGENPDEQGDEDVHANPEETLGAKPVWQKLAIVFAGPAMNLLLPVVIFVGTLAVGLPRPDTRIGMVEEGSAAAEAGLRPGDAIRSIDASPVSWWSDVDAAVRAHAGETLAIAYERGDEARTASLQVASRSGLDEFGNVATLGWAGFGHSRLRALLGIPDADGPAHAAGLRSGDLVRSVAGAPVEDWDGFVQAYAAVGSVDALSIEVTRGKGETALSVDVSVPGLGDVAALGVVPANVLISEVEADSPAAGAGLQSGDLIFSVDGRPVRSFVSFAVEVSSGGGRAMDLAVARQGRVLEVRIEPELVATDIGLGIEEERYRIGIKGTNTFLAGSIALDQARNPLVSIPRAVAKTIDVTKMFLRGLGKLVTGEVSRKQLAGPIGIAQIAGNALQRGWETYLSTLVLISINLGILNLLPIPILDGGQAVLFIVEGVKRSPLSVRTRLAFQQAGLTVLVLLMGLAFWNDLSRHWSKVVDWLRGGL